MTAALMRISDERRERAVESHTTEQGNRVEHIRDPRTRQQRQLDVLVDLVTAGTRSSGARTRRKLQRLFTTAQQYSMAVRDGG